MHILVSLGGAKESLGERTGHLLFYFLSLPWDRTRTSYTEDCLYGGLSVYVCLSLFLLGLDQLLFAYQMVFANFYLEIITPSTLCDV